jgi:MarR family 2-MHQ and catechol resistance regulon transcriptional repressor
MPTHYRGTPKETQALDAFIKLTRAAESVTARVEHRGSHGDLTPSQFGVLEALLHLGPMCQTDISKRLLKSTGNITLVIDNLEKRDLIRRVRSEEDRRFISIHLTPKGQELIEKLFPGNVAAITEEMSILDPSELDMLSRLTRKLGKREEEPADPIP